ncbi:hypothetical protein OWM54_40315 [Myxococcus sp. MISCRS1]|uniref:hypothetical protein n=1 Tax=Myxococcus sp. MISCRS1 TaxID=2996786 RepID=UPI00226EB66D|nr:hypothetical protein [Myxococcus sp. MISCRS1]MCY1003410.1 hypothetical protein [Myxococcus sp. MISCRS1]
MERVLDAGCLRKLLQVIGANPSAPADPRYVPRVDLASIDREVATIQAEMDARGFIGKGRMVRTLVYMRALMVPTDNPALGLAISRLWVLGTYCDDISEYEPENSLCLLKCGLNVKQPPSLLADYCDLAFAEVAPFCDPGFLALFKFYFYQGFVGTLFEAEQHRTGTQYISSGSEYIRVMNGFCEFWFITLQFSDTCLTFSENKLFWLEIMDAIIIFVQTVNDVLSVYKEAVSEVDFANSILYKRSVKKRVPFVEVTQQAADDGLAAYKFILAAAPPGAERMRSLLENYMKGYIYFHMSCERYGWKDVFPELTYFEDVSVQPG